MSVRAIPAIDRIAKDALDRATAHLLSLQDRAGWWKGELETNVTMGAEDLLLRAFLGVLDDTTLLSSANWIRSKQRDDGTWSNFWEGPGELSTTVEAYAALRLAGDPADAAHMERAREWILDHGGLERTRVFTRLWMALFGIWDWRDLPALPPEMIFLPRQIPLNIYDFACWARQTIVPLTVVSAFRPVRPLGFDLGELRTGLPTPAHRSPLTWEWWFERLDDLLHLYHRHHDRRIRRLALERATEWIVRRQEADGSWGGIQPPWVYSMIALSLMGYGNDHPVMRASLRGLDAFTIVEPERDVRRLEACQSPVWDTVLAMVALADAGLPADHPALLHATDWLLDQEIRQRGDWAVRRPDLQPGGWPFEFANDNYADVDDTAEVILALQRVAYPDHERIRGAIDRGVRWTFGMQSSDGGWGAFDVDNTSDLCGRIPFCDFGEVTDPPSADVTAHTVEALAAAGMARDPRVRRGLGWLSRHQEPDGSWFGRWGTNHVYGTGAVVPAAIAAGVSPQDGRIRRAVTWLREHQNSDGSWGEDVRSYREPEWIGRGTSTASQTAWALLALLAAGERTSPATERGVAWLAATQTESGTWDEPQYTGTGFPGDFAINYHLYRLVFPVQALGRYVHGWRGGEQ
jgi:squalene-hopene/tetraprenyl-beta-curcumene cyclase